MKYISTRGNAPPVDFRQACLAGLAPDGGLYVPEEYPKFSMPHAADSYVSVAAQVLSAFGGSALAGGSAKHIALKAYQTFSHPSVTPLVQWSSDRWILELHHGPTLAFKDVAMQALAQLYDMFLSQSGERVHIICATSGDTGGAAAAAFAGSKSIQLTILHPDNRISPVQRRFMTATGAANIHNFAVSDDFDACQAMVKSLFADREFSGRVKLSGVNSINWARIAAQSVYYAYAGAQFGRPIRFVVPSGNMGDALAGYVAARCGLIPEGCQFVCAVNENDALARLIQTGRMSRQAARATPSPAMDISVPSNFERLLFEITGRGSDAVRRTYESYAQSGDAALPGWHAAVFAEKAGLSAVTVSNAETIGEMDKFFRETGTLICPHTAVGTAAARRLAPFEGPTIVLATASAAKFPETVFEATGQTPLTPPHALSLMDRDEKFDIMPSDISRVRAHLEGVAA